jgi:hypothetical protein
MQGEEFCEVGWGDPDLDINMETQLTAITNLNDM